jgi:hypothetical protein
MKTYLVLFEEDNHVYDVITKADNLIEARNKVFDIFVVNTDLVTHGITQEITQKQAKDTDWIYEYIQDWINETFKSE